MYIISMGIPEMQEFWDSLCTKVNSGSATKDEIKLYRKMGFYFLSFFLFLKHFSLCLFGYARSYLPHAGSLVVAYGFSVLSSLTRDLTCSTGSFLVGSQYIGQSTGCQLWSQGNS